MTPKAATTKPAEAPAQKPVEGQLVPGPERAASQAIATQAQQQAGQVLSMLERVLNTPGFDVSQVERLWAMQKEVRAEQARFEFIAALSAMQSKIPAIKRTGQILDNSNNVQSTYAKWEHINEAIGPVLRDHGFALSFRVNQEGNAITVVCVLSHAAGHEETTNVILAPDTSGKKNAPQAVVSAISYGKRTTAGALLNITSYDEDDDGQKFGDKDATDEHMARVSDFQSAILEAIDEVELRRVGGEIAKAKFPPRLHTKVRRIYGDRLREIRSGNVRTRDEADDQGGGDDE